MHMCDRGRDPFDDITRADPPAEDKYWFDILLLEIIYIKGKLHCIFLNVSFYVNGKFKE